MSLYIQQGYGKGTKLGQLTNCGGIDGIVLSPADERPHVLAETQKATASANWRRIVDPQSYVYSVSPQGSGRFHDEYALDFTKLHWSEDAKSVSAQIAKVAAANALIGLGTASTESLIAPSGLQSTFADAWTPLGLQFARSAAAEWGAERTLATVAVDEAAFADWPSVADWLDVATTVDVRGFYLLVARTRTYPAAPWRPDRLANLLRFIDTLTRLNDYEVVWGYSDIDGLLGLVAGVNAIGSGWHYTLRNFNPSKWQPSEGQGGGKPPAPRLHLGKLWSPIRAEDEAAALYRSPLRDEIFSESLLDRFDGSSFASWDRSEAQIQHLKLLGLRARRVKQEGDLPSRITFIGASLDRAIERFRRINTVGVVLPASYRARVNSYREALSTFADAVT